MEKQINNQLFSDIARRNYYIKQFFKLNEIPIHLLGDLNNPLIVNEENIVLSCFANNFNLIFKDNSFEGNDVFSVKLKNEPELCKDKLHYWIKSATHRKIYLFKSEEGMYYNKYVKEYNGKIALFSPSKELAYYVFQRQKAIEMVQNLKKDKIDLSIVY